MDEEEEKMLFNEINILKRLVSIVPLYPIGSSKYSKNV
jgi:hypothetical protein